MDILVRIAGSLGGCFDGKTVGDRFATIHCADVEQQIARPQVRIRDDRQDTAAAVAVDRADVLPSWEGCGMMIVLVTAFTIAGQDFERREVVPSFEVCWARAAVRMEELLRVHSGIDRIGVGCWLDAGKPA